MLDIFEYCTVVHFTDQKWISKTGYFIRCVMVCKIGFANWNTKIALLRASMVFTYYIKLFQTRADRHNSILISLLLLVAETISKREGAGLNLCNDGKHLNTQIIWMIYMEILKNIIQIRNSNYWWYDCW